MSKKHKGFGNLSGQNHSSKSSQTQGTRNLHQLLATAIKYQQEEQIAAAIATYKKILAIDPHHQEALSNLGVAYKKLGQVEDAIACYRQVLTLDNTKVEIWFNLGNALQQQNQRESAEKCYARAISLQPDFGFAYLNLAKLLQTEQRYTEAAEFYRQAIARMANPVQAHTNLGNVLKALGDLPGAVAQYQQAIAKQPNYPEAYYNLGNALRELGEYEQALSNYQQALQLQPQFTQAWLNLAATSLELGNLPEAEKAMRKAIALSPQFPQAYLDLAKILQQQQNHAAAIDCLRTAWQQHPDNEAIITQLVIALQEQNRIPEAITALQQFLQSHDDSAAIHCILGTVYKDLGQYFEAITHLQQSVQLQHDLAMARTNLGYSLIQMSRLGEAIYHCQEAISVAPNLAAAHLNLGFALYNQGKVTEAITTFRTSLAIEPDSHPAHSNLLYVLNYESSPNPEAIANAHFNWGKHLESQLKPTANIVQRTERKSSRLRIGYLSPDFCQHSVAYFIEPILRHHNKTEVEIFCYANVSQADAVTERLRQLADYWRDIYRLDDELVYQQIQGDAIDILVDLAGHTGHNRLPVFARKPAPIQMTYIGYPNTTGLQAMDYRLTDAIADPPGITDCYYKEQLIRLPHCFLCYQPPANLPPVNHLPAQTLGRITFGSFNNLPKLTPEVIALWSKILQAVPNSRLILKVRWFDDQATRERYYNLFANNGIDSKRIKLFGKIDDPSHHLAFYGNIDIALDPFPYNGTTTTCEALIMGVPTLTLTSCTHAGRVGHSLLTTVGLPEWVASTPEEYVNKAVAFAQDWHSLAQLRAQLRQQVLNSPLCDALTHTRTLETTYRVVSSKGLPS
jgi:protein O-GlcNAc transferase